MSECPGPDAGYPSATLRKLFHAGEAVAWRRMAVSLAVLAVAALAVWRGVLSNGYVWHDGPNVAANLALRDGDILSYFSDAGTSVTPGWPGAEPVFRPLRSLSYRVDFALGGAFSPRTGHLGNLALHFVNTILVLLIASRIGFGALGALFVSLLFLVHPVQSEAVCWLSCRDVLLATMFVLAGCLYAVWRASRGWRLADAFVLGAASLAACLSSPQGILFPGMALFMVIAADAAGTGGGVVSGALSGPARKRLLAWTAAGVALVVAGLYVRWSLAAVAAAGYEPAAAAGGWRVALLAVVRSVGLFLAPATLTPDYSDMGGGQEGEGVLLVLGGAIAALALFLVAWFMRIDRRLSAGLAVCWLGVAAAWPVEGVFFGERMLYMPMAGFAILAGVLLQRLACVRMQVACALACAVLVMASLRSAVRVRDWADDGALLVPALEYTPDSRPVMRQLMRFFFSAGEFEKASVVADALLAVTPAGPGFGVLRAEPLRVKGMSLVSMESVDEGQALLADAVAADPYYGRAVHDMGLVALRAGRNAEAAAALAKAAKLLPFDASVREHLGVAAGAMGRPREAEAALRRAADLEWRAPSAAVVLAEALIAEGRLRDAAQVCRRSLRRFPGHMELGALLRKAGGAGTR